MKNTEYLSKKIVCAILPAYNEEENIEKSIKGLMAQSHPLDRIVIVNDFSTDNTVEIVKRLEVDYFPKIKLVNTITKNLRAGAINVGIDYINRLIPNCDFVLIADSDSCFEKNLVLEGIKSLRKENIAGVCSVAGVLKPVFYKKDRIIFNIEKWILWRLHKLEYAGFDSTRIATWKNVLILHGLCSMFRFSAIKKVGGYTPNHLLEDYKLTINLKKAGFKTFFNPRMIAETKVPSTFKSLIRQRLRWMRGGVQIILEEGINKYTLEDFFNHVLFILMTIVIFTIVILQSTQQGWHIQLSNNILPMTLAIFGYLYSIYNLKYVKNLDLIDIIIRLLIIPELVISIIYSCLQFYAYYMTIFKIKQNW